MPIVSKTSKKYVERCHDALKVLEKEMVNFLDGKEPKDEFIYRLDSYYYTDDSPNAILAVAIVDNTHKFVYAPEHLIEEQMVIFEYFLRDANSNDHIYVFSQRDYDAVKKYLNGKDVDIRMVF